MPPLKSALALGADATRRRKRAADDPPDEEDDVTAGLLVMRNPA